MTLFDKPQSLFHKRVNDLLKESPPPAAAQVLRLVPIVLGLSSENQDLSTLYKIVGPDLFSKIIATFGGRNLSLPQSSEIEEAITLAFCYYYKEVEGLSWDQIKEKLPGGEISTISYGGKIKNLTKQMRKEIYKILAGER